MELDLVGPKHWDWMQFLCIFLNKSFQMQTETAIGMWETILCFCSFRLEKILVFVSVFHFFGGYKNVMWVKVVSDKFMLCCRFICFCIEGTHMQVWFPMPLGYCVHSYEWTQNGANLYYTYPLHKSTYALSLNFPSCTHDPPWRGLFVAGMCTSVALLRMLKKFNATQVVCY